jgi:hypothetical protein
MIAGATEPSNMSINPPGPVTVPDPIRPNTPKIVIHTAESAGHVYCIEFSRELRLLTIGTP